jgi:nucleoside-diphosphate-sugar epimerase
MDSLILSKHKPKAMLLTGGAGFIGSHVAIRINTILLITQSPDNARLTNGSYKWRQRLRARCALLLTVEQICRPHEFLFEVYAC